MATATHRPTPRRQGIHVPLGRHRPQQPPGARRVEGRLRDRRHDQPAAPGHPRHQDQAADVPRRPQGQREGHHVLHPAARDDAEGRRAAAAVVRDRRARAQQRALLAAHDGHQEQDRGRLVDGAGVPRAPAPFRHAVLQPRRGGRGVGHDRRDPRPARDVQGEDARDQEQDQVGAVLPDLRDRGRDRRGVDHHGVGDPVVQEGVLELRRRPARPHADRDGHLASGSSRGGGWCS